MRTPVLVRILALSLAACGNVAPARAIPPLSEIAEAPTVARPTGQEGTGSAGLDTKVVAAPPSGPAFLLHPESLHRFFDGLAALERGQRGEDLRILQFGDSHTAADYQTGPLRRSLQQRFGDGGRGFVSVGRPWRMYVQEGVHLNGMTGWSPERGRFVKGQFAGDGRYGLVGVSIATAQRGARAYTDLAAPASRIELAYLEEPRGGTLDVIVDGARVQRIKTCGPLPRSAYVSLDLPEAPHKIELAASGDGSVRVFGMTLDRPKVGVTLDALGVNGARAGDLLRLDESHFAGELRHRDPGLVILAFGTNESADDVPLPTYEKQLVDVLGRVARAVPSASCLLLGPPDRAEKHRVVVPPQEGQGQATVQTIWTTVPRLVAIATMEQRVAEAAGCAYYSQLDVMGGPGSIAGWAMEDPPRAMLDRIHLSRQGYAELGDAVARDLIQAYDAYRSVTPSAPAARPATPPLLPPSASPVPVAGVFGR